MTRPSRLTAGRALCFATAGLLLLALVIWRQQARTPDGSMCGSVWHYRPGNGIASGGQRDTTELADATEACRKAAALPFALGLMSLGLGIVCLLVAAILVSRLGRSRSF